MSKISCCLCSLCLTMLLLLIISTFVIFIPYSDYGNYKLKTCYISKIDYPTNVNDNNWVECDCERKCKSYTPCIKLYTNISGNLYIKEDFFRKNQLCTFYNTSCVENENIEKYLNESKEIYNNYINQTIDCYYDNKITNIFMEKDLNLPLLLLFSIPFGISFLLCLILLIDICIQKFNNSSDSNSQNLIV